MEVREAFPEYKKPAVAIDTIIIRAKDVGEVLGKVVNSKQMQVLLIRRKGTDLWHLPGTILRLGETPNEAISRIMNNKISIESTSFEQLYTVDNNPLRDERGHVISIVYIGLYKNAEEAVNNIKDKYESQWFWIGKQKDRRVLRGEVTDEAIQDLDFDHEKIVCDTVDRLKGKLLYTDIAFKLVPDKFTIRELENSYAAINEREIPGFRRFIADKVEDTGEKEDNTGYRPAKIFRKKA